MFSVQKRNGSTGSFNVSYSVFMVTAVPTVRFTLFADSFGFRSGWTWFCCLEGMPVEPLNVYDTVVKVELSASISE